MRSNAAYILALATIPAWTDAATPGNQLLIDIQGRSIASVRMNTSVQQLRAEFGSGNIAEGTEELEGDKSPVVVVTVEGHKLVRHWNHLSTDDPAFQTRESLGVGSTVAAFEKSYGPASRGEGEGGWYVTFNLGRTSEFQVKVTGSCFGEDVRLQEDNPKCVVTEVLLW